ncbi:membrane protein [Phytophthora palmivora]|uniref:Membrane protein n=1 Tax=Phytophthora palmivora TaxID=4796 RepID=A0A2P4X5F6_9STRA|nr:membrane protein [Phytophthora palmivora]
MEYAKSVHSALRPRTLFASVCPVLITVSLLHKSHDVSFLQLDVVTILGCAVLTQLLGNLSAVYSNFQRTLQPKEPGAKDGKIILKYAITYCLLSLTQVQRWSYLFYGLQLTLLGLVHVICGKSLEVTGGVALFATLAFIYCRYGGETLSMVGLREAVIAWAVGPIAMVSTAIYLVGELPWAVVMYAYIVMLFAWAFLFVESARDAPFARRMGRSDTSLALRLGFQWSFQGFLLIMVSFYGVVLVVGIVMGHLGNFLLLATIVKLKDISEDFRLERLNHLPDQFARLAVFLGVGFILSILAGLS